MRYFALIDGGEGGYGVVFPDLPGCTAMAATLHGAVTAAGLALADWARSVEARGQIVPPPRREEALRQDGAVAAALAEGARLAAVLA